MKILFLDIDGVLNTSSDEDPEYIDPAKVALINEVCARTGAVVVVSSEWRQDFNLGHDGTRAALVRAGLEAEVRSFTPTMRKMSEPLQCAKRRQITEWLRRKDVEAFAVLDDMPIQIAYLVQTSETTGITRRHVERLTRILGEIK